MDGRGRTAVRWLVTAAVLGCAAARAPAPARAQEGAAHGWIAQDEVFYQIFVRSFRDANGDRIGDLRGIQESLGYLHDLGVTSLLLTPINPSPCYHNYFASRFDGVDQAYGTPAALTALVRAVHARGMKIYLDEEIQYAVADNPWFKESLHHPESRYSRWILYNGPGNTDPESIIYGITSMPEYDGSRVPVTTVNLLNTDVEKYFEDLFASLVDPNHDRRFDDGVDGFRLDHMMDDLDGKPALKGLFAEFWAPIFLRVRRINPRVKIIAEQADWGWGTDWLTRGGADLVFAFPLKRAITMLDRDSIAAAIAGTLAHTPPGDGQLVFIENHDTDRFASDVGGDPRKERIGAALDVLLQGTPLIYYGQEIGMRGKQSHEWHSDANDIPDREAFRWSRRVEAPGSAIWYKDTGPWWTTRYAHDDDGISVEEQRGDSGSLLAYYRRLLALRRARAELTTGGERVIGTDQPKVLAVVRDAGPAASLILVNLSNAAATATVARDSLPSGFAAQPLADLLSGWAVPAPAADGALRVELAPWSVKLVAVRAAASARPRGRPPRRHR